MWTWSLVCDLWTYSRPTFTLGRIKHFVKSTTGIPRRWQIFCATVLLGSVACSEFLSCLKVRLPKCNTLDMTLKIAEQNKNIWHCNRRIMAVNELSIIKHRHTVGFILTYSHIFHSILSQQKKRGWKWNVNVTSCQILQKAISQQKAVLKLIVQSH